MAPTTTSMHQTRQGKPTTTCGILVASNVILNSTNIPNLPYMVAWGAHICESPSNLWTNILISGPQCGAYHNIHTPNKARHTNNVIFGFLVCKKYNAQEKNNSKVEFTDKSWNISGTFSKYFESFVKVGSLTHSYEQIS